MAMDRAEAARLASLHRAEQRVRRPVNPAPLQASTRLAWERRYFAHAQRAGAERRMRIAAAWALVLIVACLSALIGLIVASVYMAGLPHG